MNTCSLQKVVFGLGIVLLASMCGGDILADCPAPFCDSIIADRCVNICPKGDIPFVVTVRDSCGDPVCDPGLYIDFTDCPTVPCPSYASNWPLAYPDSCNPVTGEHYFHIKAGSQDCITCTPTLYVDNKSCRLLDVKFLDISGDLCVFPDDWLNVEPCNDYNCNGFIDAPDINLHNTHLDHCCEAQTDTCTTDTLLINTGYDHVNATVYPIGSFDSYWTVTCDPDPGTSEPRPASTITPNGAWAPALPSSQWISSYPMDANTLNGVYCYQYCFCLDNNFTNAKLYIELRADDSAAVYLNGNFVVTTPINSFNTPSPTTFLELDQSKFQPGLNCITIEMSNVFSVASGLNVAGYVTADGIGLEQSYCCDSSGTIMGTKFLETDGDCVQGASEPGMAGWTITLNPGGYTAVTDIYGNYYFTGIPPGNYTVAEVLQPSWFQLCPPSGTYNVTLGVNQVISGLDFGNAYDCTLPAGPFCDSVITDPCMVVCPTGDIPFTATVRDTCGNPVCTDEIWLDFSECSALPCQQLMPNWPLVYPDSCDPTTGEHYFHPAAGIPDCFDCTVFLYVNGEFCTAIRTKFLDVTGDLCVFPDDWMNAMPCNDYTCDNFVTADDQAIHAAHLDHCCGADPCEPGPPFCDSTIADPCMVVCPKGDIPYTAIVRDTCGNPICDPNTWLDFSECAAIPCQQLMPNWPLVFPDSCDPATGTHYFSPAAGIPDCFDCIVILYVNGVPCKQILTKFLDVTGDLCVFPDDLMLTEQPCNDYNCDGSVNADDFALHTAHLDHCCEAGPCEPGLPFCDSTVTDPCLVICPLGDITHSVFVKDSCGNPICDATSVWFDFSQCPTVPCSTHAASWPIAYADSCDPATGEHFFNIRASSVDCITCNPVLFINGQPCMNVSARFLDINGDLCVTGNDFLGANPCNDYNCDGTVDAVDQIFHMSHWDHCCDDTCDMQLPGDANGDGAIDANDVIYLDNYVNSGGPAPVPQANGDVNGDCCISQADVDYLNAWLIGAGPAPVDCTCVDPPLCDCTPGDANGDNSINIGDAVYIINHVFSGGPAPNPYAVCSGDANCDCSLNIGDAVFLINFIFNGGAPPCDCCRWMATCGNPLYK